MALWTGKPKDLLSLPIPPTETIEQFLERYREVKGGKCGNLERQQVVQEDLDRVRRNLRVIQKTGAVATEDDLII